MSAKLYINLSLLKRVTQSHKSEDVEQEEKVSKVICESVEIQPAELRHSTGQITTLTR